MAKAKIVRRKSTRADGRLSTVVYLREDLLDEIQAIARMNDETAWRYVERVLTKAVKAEQKKRG